MPKEFIIYCDESASVGSKFSHFYGGGLIRSEHIDKVRSLLSEKKKKLNLFGEIKWQKITEAYADKYISLMELFFDMIAEDIIKIRIMFTQNIHVPKNLTSEQKDQEYFILYYHFIKHAFGLMHFSESIAPVRLRLLLDQLPANKEQCNKFRGFVSGLTHNPQFREAGIKILAEDIVDINSHEHDILQCLDVILGSINFRLNNMHLAIPKGKKRRGKRTRAKEAVYDYMNERMRALRPNFNIGVSTGTDGDLTNRWTHSYRHWLFVPSDRETVLKKK